MRDGASGRGCGMLVGTMRAVAAAVLLCVAWSARAAPIGEEGARHLLNRTGFGATEAEVRALSSLERDAAVDRLLAGIRSEASLAPPAFVVATNLDFSDAAFAPVLVGNLLLLGASAFWGLDNTASAVITRRVSIPAVLSVRLLLGCVFLVPVIAFANTPLAVPADAIALLVGYSVLTIVVYATALYYAFRAIGPLRSGAVLSTSALWGVLFAVLLFPTQLPSATQLAGGAAMVLALIGLYALGEPKFANGPPAPGTSKSSARDCPRS